MAARNGHGAMSELVRFRGKSGSQLSGLSGPLMTPQRTSPVLDNFVPEASFGPFQRFADWSS